MVFVQGSKRTLRRRSALQGAPRVDLQLKEVRGGGEVAGAATEPRTGSATRGQIRAIPTPFDVVYGRRWLGQELSNVMMLLSSSEVVGIAWSDDAR